MDERCGEGELFQLDEIGVGGMDSLTAFLPRPPWSTSASSTMPKQEPGHVVDELEAAEEDQEEEEEEEAALEMPPGFRFKPTDGEVIYYLEEKCANDRFRARAIAEIDINNCEPWDLPNLAKMGEKEWYFFWKRDRKYPTGSRTNRATARGYWKATGKDKEIYRRVDMGSGGGSSSKGAAPIRCLVGMKKTLVFYLGRAPKGTKSNWVMHEYRRIPHGQNQHLPITPANGKKDWVVCRVFHKTAPDATSAARNNGSETPQTPILQNPIQLPLTIYAHNQNYPYASTRDADMLLTPSLPPLLDDYPSHDSPITGNSSVLPSPAPYGYGATRLAPPPQQVPFYVPIESNVHSMMPPALSSGISIPSSTGGALLRGKCKTELQEYVTALRAAAAPSSHNLVPPRQDPCPGTSGSAGYDGGGPCSPNSSSDGPVAWLENMWDDYSSAGPIDD